MLASANSLHVLWFLVSSRGTQNWLITITRSPVKPSPALYLRHRAERSLAVKAGRVPFNFHSKRDAIAAQSPPNCLRTLSAAIYGDKSACSHQALHGSRRVPHTGVFLHSQ